jgi:hypothetical protein
VHTSASEDVDLRPSRVTGWAGWIFFAATMMIISGIFSVIWGIVGLARDQVFLVGRRGNVINLDYTTWGWINLIIGIVVIIAGVYLYTGSVLASIVAVTLAILSIVGNLLVIAAYPIWSVLVIAVDVLVIYAITVHGHELRNN